MSKLRRQALRRFWLHAHLWLGLVVGLLFALLGLTGSLLVFYPEIDLLLNPELATSTSPLAPIDWPRVEANLRATHPHRHGPWRLEAPLAADRPIMARYYAPAEKATDSFAPLIVTLDPVSLAITSQRFWGDFAVTWLYDLHYSLLLDKPGKTLLGIVGIGMLLSLLSGLYLWWPMPGKRLAALAPRLRPGKVRAIFDIHVLSGIYGLVVLLAVTVTGIVLELPGTINPLIEHVSPLFKAPALKADASSAPRISLEAALATARTRFPGATLRWIETPGDGSGSYRVNLWQAGEPSVRFPKTNVWIDAHTGAILAVRDPAGHSGGDTFLAWQHPLHNGEALGLAGRLLVCVSGLIPALLLATGLIRWRQKAQARLATLQRQSAPGTGARR